MKFNPNQRYTRWSIRRLSVGVASVVVASGFFVLIGQPSSARADVVNPTPAQVVPDVASVSGKSDLPVDVLKKAVDVTLPSEQSVPTPKTSLDATDSSEKADADAKEPVVALKEEVQAQPDSKKQTEDAVKPVESPASTVSVQDREASEAQPATAPAEVQKGVADNTKDTVDVPASYLDKANFPGPFTAGVNQVIPYEAFGGDGMLTRLILKASDKAPWSDNGTAKNSALPPVEKLGKGLYFYEVDLAGTQGKSDKELLDLLKQNGTQSYKATIKVYGAKDGKADLSNLVATKDLDVNLNGLTTPAEVQKGVADNTKDTVDVPASYLDKANFPGPFTAGVNQVIPYEFFAGDGMLTRLILKASDKAPWSDNGSAKNPALPPVEKLGKGLYFYEVDLAGTQGKSGKELLDLLKQNGTQSYKATIKVYGAKDGKADLTNLVATKDLDVNLNGLTTPAEVQKGVADNTKDTVDVPATYLDKANFPGPFTAGVNQVIPYEFFAGDGMLTRLILKASDKAPWSDNGSARNPALPPVEKLGKGLYFYEVDLAGTQGKSDKDLLDLLKQNGTQSYKATIKVYGAKDGKPDLTNLVATKDLTVNLNGLTTPAEVQKGVADNTKDTVDVPATYLDKANFPGPFTAGVNQVIPYEFFAGDGMLTRLILKASDKAPWSDNGSARNPALPPVEKLGKGLYFYEVDLAGTQGKSDKDLLDLLKQNGTQSYKATIKVYGAKDGKPDLTNLVATKDLTVNLNGLTTPNQVKESVVNNVKDMIDVPASYLDKAKVPGPFLAGVNQVIPYEAFGGDGMLTRLLLKASDKAPWSDNGTANNPALLPLEGLAKGQYFYEVDLNGNTTGKEGQALLDQLRANGTHTYQATVKVYGSKDGKPDLTNLIATRQVTIQLRGKEMATIPSQQGQMNTKPSETGSTGTTEGMMGTNHRMSDMKTDQPASSPMTNMMKKDDKAMLPNTGEAQPATAGLGIFGLALAGLIGLLGLTTKRED
ncbi:SSURE domain-containing protein [Streptococcus oralis]|uniref:YSIRK signal domain/LPXTG anchor domain surface protein n=1 Tax=Streptococcus oralis TaxID=1303 RepID=A0A4Q2FP98_STROR|nr:fibronectin-binding SSURE repeat-containing protein [Streptococcus oralis]RXX21693.1 YSIRK signal domain/LPXTG anchor domain surface protein [Streptococcus oralis]